MPGLEYVVEKLADCTDAARPGGGRAGDARARAVARRAEGGPAAIALRRVRVRPGRAHLARRVARPRVCARIIRCVRAERLWATRRTTRVRPVFFTLSSWQLGLILAVILFGATIVGLVIGRILSHHAATLREPFGAVQAALLDARRARPRVRASRWPSGATTRRRAAVRRRRERDRHCLPPRSAARRSRCEAARCRSSCAVTPTSSLASLAIGAEQRGMRRAIAAEVRHPAAALAPEAGHGRSPPRRPSPALRGSTSRA